MKKCSYCAEDIQEEAVKCKHCGEWCHGYKMQMMIESQSEPPSNSHTDSEPSYPTIVRRYLATFIDGLLILCVMILSSYIFSGETDSVRTLRIGIILIMVFVYEPFCTSKLCTLGQKLMGIRVRTVSKLDRISLVQAYLRIVVKILLGYISFFSIIFSERKRAIHDFASGSIVVMAASI